MYYWLYNLGLREKTYRRERCVLGKDIWTHLFDHLAGRRFIEWIPLNRLVWWEFSAVLCYSSDPYFWLMYETMLISTRHFIVGSTDGKIHCWNTETGAKVAMLTCDHTGPVQCVQFNPKYMMLASACSNMVSAFENYGFIRILSCEISRK